MKRLEMLGFVVVVFAFSNVAMGQPARNAVERSQDRQDLRQDNRQLADDQGDLARLTLLLQRYDHARAVHNLAELDRVELELRDYLATELREDRRETAQDRQELAESRSEVRSDRRENSRNRATGSRPGQRAKDRHDTRDDRRDRADDRRDLQQEQAQHRRKQTIANELATLYHRHDPSAIARKRALIVELWQLAQVEVQQTAAETREDQRELREDRRETREDRRHR